MLNTKTKPARPLSLLVATAAGALLAMQVGCSNDDVEATKGALGNRGLYDFSRLDTDRDQRLGWSELNHPNEAQLTAKGWNQQAVFERFDTDRDSHLNETEYRRFILDLEADDDAATAGANRAQTPAQTDVTDQEWLEFSAVETSNDGQVDWGELTASYGNELMQVGWSEAQVMEQYDRDDNNGLDETEYGLFIAELTAAVPPGQAAAAQTGGQDQLVSDRARQNQQADPESRVSDR